ncbi:fumarylacetoacetate hydrolase family protein [Bacillus sp. FJAT-47783]|uniref:fumarylacetoacetate hydrolase family protein n=1 Tax=Bacillus sp. FJAT-47783 TaxID=2922712 RepID=UPI001FAD924F|nr:fumarylacetoacetate hydrolase family protein [Bacillus sp. FJAT-47783]
MKLVTFETKDGSQLLGWVKNEQFVIDLHSVTEGKVPDNMLDFLEHHEEYTEHLHSLKTFPTSSIYPLSEIKLLAPLPNPKSFRDFYAFEEHVKNARKRRGLEMIPEWYELPVFYFSNHQAITGPEVEIQFPKESLLWDYELEIACIIGKEGRDIKADEADDYIFGLTILNDWSARDLQKKEMKVGLGPAKGKDFATSIGPYIVTKDELAPFKEKNRYHLEMTAKVNGKLLSSGDAKDMYYTFGQLIEHASRDVTLKRGDIIGSGTVGTGCILELGTDQHRWLKSGDVVELSITGLGTLKNIVKGGNEKSDAILSSNGETTA